MGSGLRRSQTRRLFSFIVTVACVGFGVLVSVAPGPAVALLAGPVLVWIAVYPERAALILIPLTPFYNMVIVRLGSAIDLRVLEFGWIAVAVGLLGKMVLRRPLRVGRIPRWLLAAGAAWLLAQVVAAAFSDLGVSSWVEVMQSAYLLLLGFVGALCVAGASDDEIRRLRSHVLASFFIAISWSALQMLVPSLGAPQVVVAIPGGVSVISALVKTQVAGGAVTLRRFGMLNLGPVASAGYLVWILGGALSSVVHSHSRARRIEPAAALIAGIALLMTFSRAGWVAGLGVVLMVVGSAGFGRAFLGSLVVSVVLIGVSFTPWVSARASELTDVREGSFADHLQMWETAGQMAGSSPLMGWGPGAFRLTAWRHGYLGPSGDPHSYLLQEAAESGLAGAFSVLVLSLGGGVWAVARLKRGSPEALGIAVGTLAMFIICLTQNGFRTELTWAPYAMTLGLAGRLTGRSTAAEHSEERVDIAWKH